ncbi:MAG TPA: DNA polymerase III subunit beta, partial [Pirellulaceae bacterium]
MKVRCNRLDLANAFQIAASVVPARSPKPILKNVKFLAREQGCQVFATDSEISVRSDVPHCETQVPGELLLSVDRFGPILRESTDEILLLESDGTQVVIAGLRSEFKLPAANPDEYPGSVEFTDDSYYRLPARLLSEVIRRTVFATDNES